MRLGASTIPHRTEPLTRSVLESYHAAGIESLELCDYHPNFTYDDTSFRTDLGEALRELEFHLNSIHIHLRHRDASCDLANVDAAHREQAVAAHRQAVDFASELGGCILVTHDIDIPEPDDAESSTRRAVFVDGVGAVAAYAAAKGVRLALENLGSGYTREPDRLVALMADIGADNVGVVIDTGHRNLSGDPANALRTVGQHLITLHLHDNHGARDEHLLPGQGAIDWADTMRALSAIDYTGVFMYEIMRPEDLTELPGNAQWIQQSSA